MNKDGWIWKCRICPLAILVKGEISWDLLKEISGIKSAHKHNDSPARIVVERSSQTSS